MCGTDFSKLSPDLRQKVLDEVGETQIKRENHDKAAAAFGVIGSPKLRVMARLFLERGQFGVAATYAQHLADAPDVVFVEEVAAACITTGHKDWALRLSCRTGNTAMVRSVEENL